LPETGLAANADDDLVDFLPEGVHDFSARFARAEDLSIRPLSQDRHGRHRECAGHESRFLAARRAGVEPCPVVDRTIGELVPTSGNAIRTALGGAAAASSGGLPRTDDDEGR